MSNWSEHVLQDRRLVVLRLLTTQEGYTTNDSVLQVGLERMGHIVSRDRVQSDLAWLAEQDLIELEVVHEKVHVARVTQRGIDVSQGRTTHPGVKRPSPG
jgi:hypothetical protein